MKPLFETEPCGRCGGSGHYSYNQITGSTCFGCGGQKVRLTRRGAAAAAWYRQQQTVTLADLKVGDLVWEENFFGGYRAWFRVDRIEGTTVDLSFKRKHKETRDEMSVQGQQSFRRRPPDRWSINWAQMVALAYQASLDIRGKPRKGPPKSA